MHCFDGHTSRAFIAPSDCSDIAHGSCLVSASMVGVDWEMYISYISDWTLIVH